MPEDIAMTARPATAPRDLRAAEIVLHIGSQKTGTTAIQEFLRINRTRLLRQEGILFPDAGLLTPGHHAHHNLVLGLTGDRRCTYPGPPERLFAELGDEIARARPRQTVLTSELFFGRLVREGADTLRRLLGRRTMILVYLRRQDRKISSQYNLDVRSETRLTTPFDEYVRQRIRRGTEDYWAALQPWLNAFGAENIVVVPYERSLDTVADLSGRLGLGAGGYERPAQANPSLGDAPLHLLWQCNATGMAEAERRRLARALQVVSDRLKGTPGFGAGPAMTPRQRRAVLDRYAESNGRVARTFLGRDALFGDDGGEGAESPRDGLDAEEVARMLLCLRQEGVEQSESRGRRGLPAALAGGRR